MTVPAQIERPVLTLPPDEAAWLTERYAAARVILEYGSGGSTVLAAEMPGTTVYSVESDLDWAERMSDYFAANPPVGTVHMHPVKIGKTGKWGAPIDDRGWRKYHHYPLTVWDRPDFIHPDLVLIDGRFRAACLIATLMRAEHPLTVLFDDYLGRPKYHEVERWAYKAEIRGRMARFEIEPWTPPRDDLVDILSIFNRQQ